MTFLQLTSLAKSYGTVAAVDSVHLDVARGSRTAIVGPSGCGKTTLLRLIAGFEVPDQGRISVDGVPMADEAGIVPAHRRNIGIVAQDGCLFPHLSVLDNIGFGMKADRAAKRMRAEELMDMVGLDRAMLARKPDQLSGGQQQRVALARAMARQPALMLLDEPFSALDTGLRAATRQAVAEVLSAAKITTILVTHDQAEALAFADQVVVMRSGRFAQVGSPREVYLRPVDAQTAAFLGEAIILPAKISQGVADCALGRLPVDAADFSGMADIMIRPEQIVLSRIDGQGVAGIVEDVAFSGAVSDARIRLSSTDFLLQARVSSTPELNAGDQVGIQLSGKAHVLAANP
jgi:iron(III) transport system ATP-binding protein